MRNKVHLSTRTDSLYNLLNSASQINEMINDVNSCNQVVPRVVRKTCPRVSDSSPGADRALKLGVDRSVWFYGIN
jgi:hypothetical protein